MDGVRDVDEAFYLFIFSPIYFSLAQLAATGMIGVLRSCTPPYSPNPLHIGTTPRGGGGLHLI